MAWALHEDLLDKLGVKRTPVMLNSVEKYHMRMAKSTDRHHFERNGLLFFIMIILGLVLSTEFAILMIHR